KTSSLRVLLKRATAIAKASYPVNEITSPEYAPCMLTSRISAPDLQHYIIGLYSDQGTLP
ncbi:hypothetical protein RRG08_062816, partial [Elysia crispata]